jgi:hypothetical protein
MPVGSAFEDIVRPYLRRDIDALTAATRVCEVVVKQGSRACCALVANEAKGEQVLAGVASDVDAMLLQRAVTHAATRRLLLDRETATDVFRDHDAGFVAIEPVMTRSGVYLGAVAAAGVMAEREAVLTALPAAGLVCSDVALELLLGIILGRKLHSFNNVLSILTANLEYVTTTIATNSGVFPAGEREPVVIAAAYAAQGAKQLIQAAVDLRDALPTGERTTNRSR